MLSLNKLEKVIELEEQLRAEYQSQLDEKTAQIENHAKQRAELQATVDAQQTSGQEVLPFRHDQRDFYALPLGLLMQCPAIRLLSGCSIAFHQLP